MEQLVATQLLDLNRQFYQTFALQFSQTRQHLQPGVSQILKRIPRDATVLDLGCGNGELWQALQEERFSGKYIGLDSSMDLLQIARNKVIHGQYQLPNFLQGDLSQTGWETQVLTYSQQKFDFILAFAVLHHLPSENLRLGVIRTMANLLKEQGQFIHSEWQFLNNQRFISHIQSWQKIGLSNEQVDEGDYLLDWRQGGRGLRYVHLFSERELSDMASQGNFLIKETFYSDGKGGNLGIYQTWVKTSNQAKQI